MSTEGEPTCTFTGVYPDGDVHWFPSAAGRSASGATPMIKKRVDEQGYVSIISSLPGGGHTGAYNCCLWNAESKTYTRCKPFVMEITRSGLAMPEGSIWRFFIVPVLLIML